MDFTIILHVTVHVTASLLDPMGLHVQKMANAVARITTLETNVNNVHLDITIILHVMHVTASLLDLVGLHVRKMANAVAMPPMVNVSASQALVGHFVILA